MPIRRVATRTRREFALYLEPTATKFHNILERYSFVDLKTSSVRSNTKSITFALEKPDEIDTLLIANVLNVIIIHTVSHWILHFHEYLEIIHTKPVNFPSQIHVTKSFWHQKVTWHKIEKFVPNLCPVLSNI